jgi:hypothetical protein
VRWWDASTGLGLTGALVDSWTARVGAEIVSNTGAARPSLNATHASFNNLPVLNFGIAGTELFSSPSALSALMVAGQALSIYTVARRNTLDAGATADFWLSSGTLASTLTELSLGTTDNGVADVDRLEINATIPGQGSDWGTNARVYSLTVSAGGAFNTWLNGVPSISVVSALPTGTNYLLIGGGRRLSATNTGFEWRGEIAEIVVYLATHAPAQRVQIENAMRAKYAV